MLPTTYKVHDFDTVAFRKHRLAVLGFGNNFPVPFDSDTDLIEARLGKVLGKRLSCGVYIFTVNLKHSLKIDKKEKYP